MRSSYLFQSFTVFGALALTGCFESGYYREQRVIYQSAPGPVIVAEPQAEVVVTTFYADLAPQGQWVEISGYGRCWHPNGVSRNWRPYTVGYWVYTDFGWSWESDEPWGYATYHYGRWFEDSRYGWSWMPGSTWAPAWVAWRSGGGYVGWAPLGPSIRVAWHSNFRLGEVETRDIPASHYNFVQERSLTDRRLSAQVVNIQNNTTIINKTTNITNITTVNNTVVNQSLSVDRVERATGQKVQRRSVKEAASLAEARQLRSKGDVAAYRPKPLVQAEKAKPVEIRNAQPAVQVKPDADRIKREQAVQAKAMEARQASDRAKAIGTRQPQPAAVKPQDVNRVKREQADRAKAMESQRQAAEKAKAIETRRPQPTPAKPQDADRIKREQADQAKAMEARQASDRAKAANAPPARAEKTRPVENTPPADKSKPVETNPPKHVVPPKQPTPVERQPADHNAKPQDKKDKQQEKDDRGGKK